MKADFKNLNNWARVEILCNSLALFGLTEKEIDKFRTAICGNTFIQLKCLNKQTLDVLISLLHTFGLCDFNQDESDECLLNIYPIGNNGGSTHKKDLIQIETFANWKQPVLNRFRESLAAAQKAFSDYLTLQNIYEK